MNRHLFSFNFTVLFFSNILFGQSKMDGLRYDDTKFSLGISIPFGVSTYMYNVRDKWGGFISLLYAGGPGIDDDNFLSPYHELTDSYIVNYRGGSMGLMYRLWRPFHIYGGIGIGWSTRQLVYEDTPPVVLEDVHMTSFEGIKPMANIGIQFTLWRVSLGGGYNTFVQGPEFFLGYTVKVPKQ